MKRRSRSVDKSSSTRHIVSSGPSRSRSVCTEARSFGSGVYELEAIPSVIPAFQAISAVRRAGALLNYGSSSMSDRIQGELWYIAHDYGPGRSSSAGPQWVTCDSQRLVIWSSWSDQGRIIDTTSFDSIRLILNFAHIHSHNARSRQAPVTRYNGRPFPSPRIRQGDSVRTFRRGTAILSRCRKRFRHSASGFCTKGGKVLPRYYYFGLECSSYYRSENGRRKRRRRLMMFTTDIHSDFITWLQFMSDMESKNPTVFLKKSKERKGGSRQSRGEKFNPDIAYFLNESDTNIGDESIESLSVVEPEDIEITIAPEETNEQEDVRLPVPFVPSLIHSTTSKQKSDSYRNLSDISDGEGERGAVRTASTFSLTIHSQAQQSQKEETKRSATPSPQPDDKTEEYAKKIKGLNRKKKRRLKVAHKTAYDELREKRLANENMELRHKNELYQIKVEKLTRQVRNLEQQLASVERVNHHLQDECDHLRKNMRKVETERATLALKLVQLNKKEFSLRREIDSIREINQELLRKIAIQTEHITVADARLRCAEGECETLGGLLGLAVPSRSDGGSATEVDDAREASLSLMDDAERIAENLRLASKAVRALETRLKESEERGRAAEEECERLREELRDVETDREALETNLQLSAALEGALRHQLQGALDEVRSAETALSAAECALYRLPEEVNCTLRASLGEAVVDEDESTNTVPGSSLPARIEHMARRACRQRDDLCRRLDSFLDAAARGVCDDEALSRLRALRSTRDAAEAEQRVALAEAEERLCVVTECVKQLGDVLGGSVVMEREAELLRALRADIEGACGVARSRVVDAALVDDGSQAVFRVVHSYRLPSAVMLARVDACAFDRVRRMCASSHADGAVMVEMAVEDEDEGLPQRGADEIVLVGTPAGEEMIARVTELSERYAAANDELCATEKDLMERSRTVVRELERRVAETRVEVEVLTEHITVADARLRCAEGECETLGGLLGLAVPSRSDGGSATEVDDAREASLSLMDDAERIAENLRLASKAVRALETRLKESEERGRAAEEECERLREELRDVETDREALETNLQLSAALEGALRHQLQGALDEVRSAETALSAAECALYRLPEEVNCTLRASLGEAVVDEDESTNTVPGSSLPARIEHMARRACRQRDDLCRRLDSFLDAAARGVCDDEALSRLRALRSTRDAAEAEQRVALAEAEERLCVVTECVKQLGDVLGGSVVMEREAELLRALRADIEGACGVARSRVVDAALVDDGSQAVFRVVHSYRLPSAVMLARVDACAFDRVRRMCASSHADGAVMVEMAVEDEDEGLPQRGADEIVLVGTPAGEEMIARVTELSERYAAANDELCATEKDLMERSRTVVRELERRVAETRVEVEVLTEHITVADARLRCAEGECETLGGLLGLAVPSRSDGGSATEVDDAREASLSLMDDAERIAENLRLASKAVRALETRLKESEERGRAAEEECERLREELRDVETDREALETNLQLSAALEGALRHQLQGALDEVRSAETALSAAECALYRLPEEVNCTLRASLGEAVVDEDESTNTVPGSSLPARIEHMARRACRQRDDLCRRLDSFLDAAARGVCDDKALSRLRALRSTRDAAEAEQRVALAEAEERLCVVTECVKQLGDVLGGSVVMEREAELLRALRADIEGACGVARSRVVDAALVDDGSQAVFRVVHSYRLPSAVMLARVDACAFDRVRRMCASSHADGAVMVEMAVEDEDEGLPQRGADEIVLVGTPAGEEMIARVTELSERYAAANDELCATEKDLMERSRTVVRELERRVAETRVEVEVLTEHITVADARLRCAEGECETLGGLLGLAVPSRSDGGSATEVDDAREASLSLMDDAERIAENLRLASKAVRALETRLKESEERGRAAEEECERLREELRDVETDREALETNLQLSAALEGALRHQLQGALDEVRSAETALSAAECALYRLPEEVNCTLRASLGEAVVDEDESTNTVPGSSLPARIEHMARRACRQRDDLCRRLDSFLDAAARGVCDDKALSRLRALRSTRDAAEAEQRVALAEAEERLCVVTECVKQLGDVLGGSVVMEREAELLRALRADIEGACGVARSRVVDAALVDDGSQAVFRVVHSYRLPSAVMLARVDACAFDRVRRMCASSHADGAVMVEMAVEDEDEGLPQRGADEIVLVGTPAGEEMIARVTELSERYAAANDELCATEKDLMERSRTVVRELERRVAETRVEVEVLTEHITVADARLRCAEGECETLGGLLGLAVPSRSDGGSATEVDDAREASLSLMDDAERIAENLRLASKAVRALETRLKESEERGRAAEEECERLREELRDVETDREALETNLQLSAALEGALRHQLQGALDEVRSAETALSAAECALYRLPEEVNCTLRASLGEAVVDEDESTNTVPGSSLPARIEHMARRACRQRDDLCRRLDSFLDAAARGVCDDKALSRLRALRSTRDAAEAEQRVALAEAEERLCVVTECVKQLGDVLGGSVVMEREAELLRALRADIEGACGVARSRVVDAALVDDGSQAVFRVVHSYRLPSAVMLARVDACAFDRVRRMCASSHADGAVMVEMAVEDEDEGLPQRGADEIVLVGTPAGEEMIARVTELSERYAAANDELCATEKDLMERSRTVVRELERRVAETRVEVEVLTEHITVADARLRCAEGECETLGGLLGLAVPSRSDGGSATEVDDAREASLSLMDDAERIAENLRLASKAVRALETRLKESEERGRAAEEECERLREELRDVETDREALETNLQLSAALEGALRHQLQGALDEVRSAETALSAAECALYRLPEEVNCTLRASLGEAVVDEDESTNTVPGSSLPARIEHMTRRACRQRDDLCRRLDSFLDAAARGVCDDEALSRLRALRSTRDAAEAEQRVALAEAEERLCVVTECVKQLGDVLGGSVVMEREAELLRALRADIEGACGVARSRVVDAALVDDGSQAVFRVVHSYRLPSAVMLARVDACAFDRVRRMCASSHADGAVMVEMAVEDEDEGLPQRGADEIVLVGTPAGEEMIARVTELSERYAAANDELCATEKDLMERSRTVVRELERRVAETRVEVEVLTEHITVADARLRCAEGECETLGGLLGLAVPSRSDGGSATEVDDAREASLSLMDDAERIAENLRLASKAVRALETRLKESEERGRAAEEECERLREELRDVETDREALETNLQLSAALEGALRHQLQGALDEVRSAETALSAAECALYRLPEEVNCTLRASLGEAVVDEDESTNTVPGSSLPARIEHMTRRACRQRDDLCRRLDSFLDAAARGVCDDEALSRLRALRSTRDAAEAEQRVALAEAEERLCVVTECVKQLGDVLGGSVVMEREAELLRALRADIEGACGVARSRVVDAALVDDGSQAVFRVVHSYRLPSAVMLARVDACAFDRVRRMCASSHADGAVMVEMAVEDEDEGLPQRGADEIVLVGTPAGEEMIARVTELSERYAAANDELCATEKDLMERSRTVVRELERRVAETRVEVEVLTEHITVADARLRCAEGECETLGGLLGLAVPSRSDGGSATEVDDAREASLSLMDDAERIAENLRLASKAVRALETRLKESEERGRAAEEECERLREELRDVETDREALETNLQLSAALEGALRHQLQGALDEVRSAETALSAAECALYRLPEEVNCTLRASLGEAVVDEDESTNTVPGSSLPARIEHMARRACRQRDDLCRRLDSFLDAAARGVCDDEALSRLRALRSTRDAAEAEQRVALAEAEERLCVVTECVKQLGDVLGGSVVMEREAELLRALRADIEGACGVARSRVVDAALVDDGSQAVFRVVHSYRLPSAVMLARVDACAFDRVRRMCASSHADGAVMVEMAVEDEDEGLPQRGADEIVLVGTPAGEEMIARVTELSERYAAANDELCATEKDLMERSRTVVRELERRVAETRVEVEVLTEHITVADARLRCAEGECETLGGLLGLAVPSRSDGGSATEVDDAREASLSLMDDAERIAENLRLASKAVRALETRLKESEERGRAAEEECERLREELRDVECKCSGKVCFPPRFCKEVPLGDVCRDCHSRVFTLFRYVFECFSVVFNFCEPNVDWSDAIGVDFDVESLLSGSIEDTFFRLEEFMHFVVRACRGLTLMCEGYEAGRVSLLNSLENVSVDDSSYCVGDEAVTVKTKSSMARCVVEFVRANINTEAGDAGACDVSDARLPAEVVMANFEDFQAALLQSVVDGGSSCHRYVTDIIKKSQENFKDASRALSFVRDAFDSTAASRSFGGDNSSDGLTLSGVSCREAREVVSLVRKQRQSVISALISLLSCVLYNGKDSIDGIIRWTRDASFTELVTVLHRECCNASTAFSSLKMLIEHHDGGESNTSKNTVESNLLSATGSTLRNEGCGKDSESPLLVEKFEDIVADASRRFESVKRDKQPLQDASVSSLSQEETGNIKLASTQSQAPEGPLSCSVSYAALLSNEDAEEAERKAELLLSLRDLVEATGSTPRPFAIVQQVREHIAARTEELKELRTAATRSVETLGGDALPSSAKPHDIAGALLAAVKATSDSIGGVHALLSGASVEETTITTTRNLKPRPKPKPVGHSSTVPGSFWLQRTVLLSSGTTSGRWGCAPKQDPSPTQGASLNPRENVNSNVVSGALTPGGQTKAEGPQKLQDLINAIRSKLAIVRNITDMCGASLCLLGEDSETTISMEDLPLRLLLRAQELYHALEEVRKFNLPDDDDSSAASCSGTSDRMGSTGIKPSFISSRLSKIISTIKVLQNDNEILRQGHTAFDKQRAFLMQDTDALRLMYTNEKKQLEEALSGTKEQLRERGAELEEVQRQSALLQELYDKACGDCERMEQELDSMRGTLGNIQQSFTGAESAAKVVHNTSVDLLDSICVIQQRLLGTAPALSTSTSDAPHVQPGSETPEKGVKQLFYEGGLEMDASVEPKNGNETLPQLLADSSRCLVLCKEPLQQLWHSCGVVPVMFEWVKQYCLYAKNYLRDGEEEIRALMRTRFRETEDLLRDKSRVSQRYREVQQELDNVHVQWRERLQCVEAVHREHTEVLNRRLAAMWDLSTQHDVLRAERSRWESCAEAAEKEASRLRELLRLAELKLGDRCVSVKQARPTRDVASLTEFGILEVGYESAPPKRLASRTDEEMTQLLKQLSDALAYAKHQADDASRCRALMQDQLLLLDGGRTSVGQPQLPIRKLIEAHRERIESFIKEHGRLVGDWLSAQNDISRLKQLALEREQERQNEAEELRSRIKELRTLVQRKLEMDMITERQMMDAEHLIDRQFEEMCHRASSGLTVMQNLQDLRGALLARIRMQRNTQASFGRDAAFAGAL